MDTGDHQLDHDLVPILSENQERFDKLRAFFREKYNENPSYIVRVPGRVNLIGEHIDYCGFGVLPMAIEQDVLIAAKVNYDRLVRLANMDSDKYPDVVFPLENFTIAIPPNWYHYVLCGLQGAKDLLKCSQNLEGLNIAIWGIIPSSSGLSSSSALVTASLLATYYSAGYRGDLCKLKFADAAAKCERYIGTQGGAMDQSIAMLARSGFAKLIEFEPILRAADVRLPVGSCFFFSHSGKTCNKAATEDFNARVLETKVASLMIVDHCHSIMKPGHITCPTLAQIKKQMNKNFDEMLEIVNEFERTRFSAFKWIDRYNGEDAKCLHNYEQGFKIHDRATHVYSEAQRVEKVHDSCSNLYECSCPEVDTLVAHAKSFGALGSRMTGAGWGGGVVSLVPEHLSSQFHEPMAQISLFTVASLPSQGATIYI
uniref:Galactokinase n=1 Tax=Tetranychus urticae TaxID=32264 RepID=T1KBE8_TETUR